MMRVLAVCAALTLPGASMAQTASDIVAEAVTTHVLPRYAALVDATSDLAAVAQDHCAPGDAELEAAFHDAFDAWIGVSHITFGPIEGDGRYFALSFWPDARGMTGRSLTRLIEDQDAIVEDQEGYTTVSVAARGFYALEFLLYDPQVSTFGDPGYRCTLVQAITTDIAATAALVHGEWTGGFTDLMLNAGNNDRFQSPEEALRVLFSAVSTGLEFTIDLRLGRPMGSFDAPRPNRAEARRSGRSLRHVILSLDALDDLSGILAQRNSDLAEEISVLFAAAIERGEALDDPSFAGVADTMGRVRVEGLQRNIVDAQSTITQSLGPALGVAAGFNSLDGD